MISTLRLLLVRCLKKVEVTDSGDSLLVEGDTITKTAVLEENEKLIADGLSQLKLDLFY